MSQAEGNRFYGKYRGKVISIADPKGLGRIQAEVPDALGRGTPCGWANPCAVFAGMGVGLCALPSVGANVWIEFEQGNLDHPIWSGCFWDEAPGAMPPPGGLSPPFNKVLIRTAGGNQIILDDTPGAGGITLQTSAGQRLVLSATGISLQDQPGPAGQQLSITPSDGIKITTPGQASVQLLGPKVSINGTALEVL